MPLAFAGFLVGQVLYAAHRNDLPSHENQDPSGRFGAPTMPLLRLVALGDSSITGPGVDRLDDIWVRRVGHHLGERYHVELQSLAVGGAKAGDVLRDQVPLVTDADIAFVSVGANDAIRATPVRRFERELDHIIGALSPKVRAIVVSGVGDLGTIPRLPTLPSAAIRRRARAIDDAIARAVALHPPAAKCPAWSEPFHAFRSDDPELWAGDQFHASGKGHGIFAEAAIPVVEETLGRL